MLLLLFAAGFLARLYSYYNIYLPQTNGTDNRSLWVSTIYYPTYCRLDGLLAGVGIAALYNYLPAAFARLSKYANGILAAGVLLLAIAYFVCESPFSFSRSIIGFPLVSIGFGCLVMGAIMPGSFLYKWKSAAMSMIARLSYSLYLIHMGVILMVQKLFSYWGLAIESNLMFVLSMLFCVAFSLLLHYSIEKPFMKMRERFLKPMTQRGEMKIVFTAAKIES